MTCPPCNKHCRQGRDCPNVRPDDGDGSFFVWVIVFLAIMLTAYFFKTTS